MNFTYLEHARAGKLTAWMCGSEEFLECKLIVFASFTRKQRNRKVMRNRYAKTEKKSNLEQEVVIITHTDPSNYSL